MGSPIPPSVIEPRPSPPSAQTIALILHYATAVVKHLLQDEVYVVAILDLKYRGGEPALSVKRYVVKALEQSGSGEKGEVIQGGDNLLQIIIFIE